MANFSVGSVFVGAGADRQVRAWRVVDIVPIYTSVGESPLTIAMSAAVLDADGRRMFVATESLVPSEDGTPGRFQQLGP